ncbi:hypothetical protein DIJ64_07260 [Mycobacterium leprae]|uniref:Uncharacterized protein n=1 Tax=Mycobacterium leprae TaxID=1769 RepID=A0AAD0KS88_MYCLR|nr:hypothetical protein DIJ64_07260 [Mycobacterium leprae]OAR20091.1 hypothetical protein A8144_12260 [Mycobacterium leprae 3125609]OAX70473.1 hypothetical protein A3216_11840 [Mycobacterium leprae 7935681]
MHLPQDVECICRKMSLVVPAMGFQLVTRKLNVLTITYNSAAHMSDQGVLVAQRFLTAWALNRVNSFIG